MITKIEITKIGNLNLNFERINTNTIFKYNMFFCYENTNFKVKVENLDNYKKSLDNCIDMFLKSKEENDENEKVEMHKNKFIREYKNLNLDSLKKLRNQAKQYMFDEKIETNIQYHYIGMFQASDTLIRNLSNN